MRSLILALLSFAVSHNGLTQERVGELIDARYSVQQGMSRLTFTFDESVRYAQRKLNANQVRLLFPNSITTKFSNRVPLIFRSGYARSVSFDFSRVDTVAVIVSMNENVAFDLRRRAKQIVMEMYATDTAKIVPPFIDIRAMSQQQTEDAKEHSGKTASSKSYFDIQPIPFIAACFISLLGTAGLMYWVIKPPPPQRSAPNKAAIPTAKAGSHVDALVSQAKLILREKSGSHQPRPSYEGFGSDHDDGALMLAKTFSRGQGEMQLARTLGVGNRQYKWEKKLQGGGVKESVSTAKRLGVGRGELNLATSLRRMQETSRHKQDERNM